MNSVTSDISHVVSHDTRYQPLPESDSTLPITDLRTVATIGTAGESFVNISLTNPSKIFLYGADMSAKYGVVRGIVDVWTSQQWPVFVISPNPVSDHSAVKFYRLTALKGEINESLEQECEKFLESEGKLKLLVINSSHKSFEDEGSYISRLCKSYYSQNLVVLYVCNPPSFDSLTAVIATFKRGKTESVWSELCSTWELGEDFSLGKMAKGTLLGVNLNDNVGENVPFTFQPLK